MLAVTYPVSAKAFMTSAPGDIGLADMEHRCPNDNSINSCFQIGIKSGLEAGKEMKQTGNILYSLVGGVGGQHSPNFSLGYLLGYDKAYLGKETNSSYINYIANKTGFEDGGNANSSRPPLCTVNNTWCSVYSSAFENGYTVAQPYWVGHQRGEVYAEHVITSCTQKEHPDFSFLKHHTAQYKEGFLNAYNDAVAAASNDNGTYGPKECK